MWFTLLIYSKIYLYIIIGVGVGAFIHGYIPADFIAKYAGGDVWYAPIIAVLAGIPMYSKWIRSFTNYWSIDSKGVLIGTAISFMMSSCYSKSSWSYDFKRILSIKLIAIFFSIVGLSWPYVGYL